MLALWCMINVTSTVAKCCQCASHLIGSPPIRIVTLYGPIFLCIFHCSIVLWHSRRCCLRRLRLSIQRSFLLRADLQSFNKKPFAQTAVTALITQPTLTVTTTSISSTSTASHTTTPHPGAASTAAANTASAVGAPSPTTPSAAISSTSTIASNNATTTTTTTATVAAASGGGGTSATAAGSAAALGASPTPLFRVGAGPWLSLVPCVVSSSAVFRRHTSRFTFSSESVLQNQSVDNAFAHYKHHSDDAL